MIDTTFNRINRIVPDKWKWILNHEGFRKYFKNTGWMFLTKILSLAVSFITTIFIARNLGPSNYGQLSYAISFVGLFSFIATMGLDQVLYRELVKYPDKRNQYLGSAFIIKILSSLLAITSCLAMAMMFSQDDVSIVLIFIISSSFVFNSFQIISTEFQAIVKAKYPSIISLIIVTILNILKIFVIISGRGVIYLALVLLLESILYAALYIIIYKQKLNKSITNWSFDKQKSLKLISDSWPIIFSSAFALIYARIDQVMIKNFIDSASVGIYDAAVRISEAWYFVPNIILTSLFPAIVGSKQKTNTIYVNRLRSLFTILLILSMTVALVVTIFSSTIIHIFYGNEFAGSSGVLKIYIWSSVIMTTIGLLNSYLLTENFKNVLFWSSFIAMFINIVLNIILIPLHGISGAAWATLISYSLVPISMIFFKKSKSTVMYILRIKKL